MSSAKRTLTTVVAILACTFVWLDGATVDAQSTERLGKINFPTSCAPAAQPHFERGVALLHSFWFGEAIKALQAAALADPSCGIAHWGTAVAYLGNPLAGPPAPRGLQEGAASVTRAKAAGAKSQRAAAFVAIPSCDPPRSG